MSPFQAVKTWKTSTDPDFEAKKNRVLELYAIADGKTQRGPGDPTVVICVDEFGPLNLQPHPGKQWVPTATATATGAGDPGRPRRRRRRATYVRLGGVRHLFAGYDLSCDKLDGHVKTRKARTQFLPFCRYLRALHPAEVSIALVLDNFSPHLTTKTDSRVGAWAAANNVELAYVPFYGSWLNRIEAHFTALRYFALDGTDHADHHEQAGMIRRYIAWRNRHVTDPKLRKSFTAPNSSSGRRLPDAALVAASDSADLLRDPPRIELRALRNAVQSQRSEFLSVRRNKRAPSRACWRGLRGLGSEATKCDRRKKRETTDKTGLLHDAP